MKECGAKWKTLDADTKAPFQELADKDKERYDAEMEDYEPEGGHGKTAKKRKTKVLVHFLSFYTFHLGSQRSKTTTDCFLSLCW